MMPAPVSVDPQWWFNKIFLNLAGEAACIADARARHR
jgi:hypothetical protein